MNEGHETSESGFDVKYARARKDHSDAKKKLAQLREGLILKMAQMRTKEDLGEADSLGYIMLQGEVDTQLETITMQEADVERASKYLRELEASGKIWSYSKEEEDERRRKDNSLASMYISFPFEQWNVNLAYMSVKIWLKKWYSL